jgi:S1-C subfamily serine protease
MASAAHEDGLCDDRRVNPLDALVLLLLVAGVILGWRSGAIPQVAGLLGAVGGGALVILVLPSLADPLAGVEPAFRPILVLIALVGAVAIGESVGASVGRVAAQRLGNGILGAADRTAGAALGAAQAILIVWLLGGLLAEGPLPRLAQSAATSTAIRTISTVLPPPTDLAVGLGKFLDATGLPDVFVGFEPLPAPPVDMPSDPRARAIAAAAEASTVKVSAATCGFQSVGTGFAVGSGYVVTNAHVVAGAPERGIRVTAAGGRVLDAVPVFFDPELDVALLRVDQLPAIALRWASKDPERGALGATLGYPGGRALTILPAAVASSYPATGRDIYGADHVRRKILELRAEIEPGDSGGPLVLADGTVGGVVFAEAKADPNVGYALAATEVSDAIRVAIGRTRAVDTGECVR